MLGPLTFLNLTFHSYTISKSCIKTTESQSPQQPSMIATWLINLKMSYFTFSCFYTFIQSLLTTKTQIARNVCLPPMCTLHSECALRVHSHSKMQRSIDLEAGLPYNLERIHSSSYSFHTYIFFQLWCNFAEETFFVTR